MKTGRIFYIIISWVLVIVFLSFIFSLSAQNAEDSKELSDSLVRRILDWLNLNINGETLRKFAHMLEFTALSLSLCNAFFATWEKKSAPVISLALTILCALGDEIHQAFVPGRAFQMSDIFTDSIGAVLGVIAYLILYKIYLMIQERGNKNGSIKTI